MNAAKTDTDRNAGPSDWYQTPRTYAANTIWHEAMHAWGYRHPGSNDPNYNKTIPQLVGACVETVMVNSSSCNVSCGVNRRPIMRFGSTVCDCVEDPQYDVGVILEAGESCPTMPGRGAPGELTLAMDDEDDSNNTTHSGWFGQLESSDNTRLKFCVTSGVRFRQAVATSSSKATYAVAKMGVACPAGSTRMARYFDNEDDSNRNTSVGHVPPHSSTSNTRLELCMFRGAQGNASSVFPQLGSGYGVFAGSELPGALKTGSVYTDDEDSSNNNYVTGDSAGSDTFLAAGDNTTLRLAKVRDGGSCGGSAGGWNGCRGSGCWVCSDLTRDYPRYYINHPSCSPNTTCDGQQYPCNAECPAPTDADR